MSNNSEIKIDGKPVELNQTTDYPWNGDINIEVNPKKKQEFKLKIRVPGWVLGDVVPSDLYKFADKKKLSYSIKVNDEKVEGQLENGYFSINKKWQKGDKVEVHFDMEPRIVKAHPLVEADAGKLSVERGPIVYCAEWPDNEYSVLSAIMPQKPEFLVENKPDLLYGLNMISTESQLLAYNKEGKIEVKDVELNMIPYYAWAHRGSGEMSVWLANDVSVIRPTKPPSIASESKIDASHNVKSISAINDQLIPKDEHDRTVPYYHWGGHKGTDEWIVYTFDEKHTISESAVYWYDDGPWGGCRIPANWKLFYKDMTNEWKPVETMTDYSNVKGHNNVVKFKPVKTTAIKIEVKLPEKNASGIYEWSVK